MKELGSPMKAVDFSKILKAFIVVAILLLVFLVLIIAGQLIFFFQVFGWFQHQVRNVIGGDVLIANGITALLMAAIFTLPLWAFLKSFLPFPQKHKKLYRASVFIIFAILSFASYFSSQDVFFDPNTGDPLKYYTIRPDGRYKFYSSGGYDELTGDTLRRVTVDVIRVYLGQVWTNQSVPSQSQSASPSVVSTPRVEEFRLNNGDTIRTVFAGPGTYHRIWANKRWEALSKQLDGNLKPYAMPAGYSSWDGGEPEGLLKVRGLNDGTLLRFERLR